jgi:hypothetical protein
MIQAYEFTQRNDVIVMCSSVLHESGDVFGEVRGRLHHRHCE